MDNAFRTDPLTIKVEDKVESLATLCQVPRILVSRRRNNETAEDKEFMSTDGSK